MTFETKQKKRKAAASAPSPAAKKSKKTASIPAASTEAPITRSATRKKAADFMSDDDDSEDGWAALKAKGKKGSTAAGGKDKPKKTAASREEKNSRKQNKELEKAAAVPAVETPAQKQKRGKGTEAKSTDEDVISLAVPDNLVVEEEDSAAESESEEIDDQTATLLKGFESSDDEGEGDEAPIDAKKMAIAKIPDEMKVKKKLGALTVKDKTTPGVLYLGRIPHGFYEQEMRSYFSQFGTVTRLRLSRNKKTGHSKHFAFIEFADAEVARIVAETMDNYLLFGHILKCKPVPRDDLEFIENLFKGGNKRYRPRSGAKIQKAVQERKRTAEEWEKQEKKEVAKRKGINEKLKKKGIDYTFNAPEVKKPEPMEIDQAAPPAVIQETVPEKTLVAVGELVEKAVEVVAEDDGIEEVEVQAVVKRAKIKSKARPPAKVRKPAKKPKA